MGWFFALIFAAVLAVVAWRHRRFRRHWTKLEQIVDDLVESREPRSFVFLNGGRFVRIAAALERLAEARERLRRRRSREEMNLQTILASMEDGVMVVDRQHNIRLVNPSVLNLFGLAADPLGRSVLQTLRESAFDEIISGTLTAWEPQSREVSVGASKTPHFVSVHAMPMRNASGEEGVVTIFRDVTRLKQLEEMRREFVANVSHELRTPLSIFHGYLENLRDNPNMPRAELVETIGVLEKHSLRLNALVEDLLILARLESRDMRLQLEEIEVESFLRELMGDWKLRSARKNISTELSVAPGMPPLVADVLRLEQVVSNLLDNAIKYSPAGGHVWVRAAMIEGEIELRVEDNGVGILPGDLPHIFERFYRADKARTREQGGTGLGLSIVKHIVQTHGGTVRAESAFSKGTTIVLRFPVRQPDAALEA